MWATPRLCTRAFPSALMGSRAALSFGAVSSLAAPFSLRVESVAELQQTRADPGLGRAERDALRLADLLRSPAADGRQQQGPALAFGQPRKRQPDPPHLEPGLGGGRRRAVSPPPG